METHESYDPATALQDAERARTSVAARARAPRYYYPVLGAVVAVFIAGVASGRTVSIVASGLCAVISGVLAGRYRNATGVWITWGRAGRARGVWTAFAVGLLALLAVALWLQHGHASPWWGVMLGVLGFCLTMVTGRLIEPRLRAEIGQASPAATARR